MSRTLYKSVPDLSKARDRTASPKTIREGVNVTPAVAEYAKGRRYFIKTFGCQGNVRDEEILAGYLEAASTRAPCARTRKKKSMGKSSNSRPITKKTRPSSFAYAAA